jgi:hypothetical protein
MPLDSFNVILARDVAFQPSGFSKGPEFFSQHMPLRAGLRGYRDLPRLPSVVRDGRDIMAVFAIAPGSHDIGG